MRRRPASSIGVLTAVIAVAALGPGALAQSPTVGVEDASTAEGDTGSTALGFTVTLSEPSDAPVTVEYATADGTATGEPPPPLTVVTPTEIDDILYNPGMGFANTQGDIMYLQQRGDYPDTRVTYIRWYWDDLEPQEGDFAFGMVDEQIALAWERGETFAFRLMAASGEGTRVPQWLIDKGIAKGNCDGYAFEPDFADPVFMEHMEKLVAAFGERYDGHPRVDHVDIGGFGCWGEWNLAGESYSSCGKEVPSLDVLHQYVAWHLEAFPTTPLTIPENEAAYYAIENGTGWRADCLGDWGMWGPNWNHMEDLYPAFLAGNPIAPEAWREGPIQFEICSSIDNWYSLYEYDEATVQATIDWSIEQHSSVINLKYLGSMPDEYWPLMLQWQRRLGFRFVLAELQHTAVSNPGSSVRVVSSWSNVGIAPVYRSYRVAYRLRDAVGSVAAVRVSGADLATWLPGEYQLDEHIALPVGMATGGYFLDVAVLDVWGDDPAIDLAIAGRRDDGWYPVSEVAVQPGP